MVLLKTPEEFDPTMMRALTLCSLLLLPMTACDDTAFELVEAAGGPAGIPDPPDVAPLDKCGEYCAQYLGECGVEGFGYTSVSHCESVCGYWESGQPLACRLDELDSIAEDDLLVLGCADAGPDSDACGSGYVVSCDRYCDEFRSACGDDDEFASAFESPEKCRAWCDGEPLTGDHSIECRLSALEAIAAPLDCEAASPRSTCN